MDLSATYRDKSPSLPSKVTLSLIHFFVILAVMWLLFGSGATTFNNILGVQHRVASPLRRAALASAAVLYFLRTLLTLFVFYRRRLPWSEAVMIAVWIGIIDLLFAYFGGRNEAAMGALGIAGGSLVVVGSLIHTGAEWQRDRWKRDPARKGQLLTTGMWAVARHINYFGDVVLFSGWALLTGRSIFLTVPAAMICLFVFINVPAQDRYLAGRYGEQYEAYARQTARLIPYVY